MREKQRENNRKRDTAVGNECEREREIERKRERETGVGKIYMEEHKFIWGNRNLYGGTEIYMRDRNLFGGLKFIGWTKIYMGGPKFMWDGGREFLWGTE